MHGSSFNCVPDNKVISWSQRGLVYGLLLQLTKFPQRLGLVPEFIEKEKACKSTS